MGILMSSWESVSAIFTILNLACFTDFGVKIPSFPENLANNSKPAVNGRDEICPDLGLCFFFWIPKFHKKKTKKSVVPGGEISFSSLFAWKISERWKPLHLFLFEACHLSSFFSGGASFWFNFCWTKTWLYILPTFKQVPLKSPQNSRHWRGTIFGEGNATATQLILAGKDDGFWSKNEGPRGGTCFSEF